MPPSPPTGPVLAAGATPLQTIDIFAAHILHHLSLHRDAWNKPSRPSVSVSVSDPKPDSAPDDATASPGPSSRAPPLIVGMQGPQGSGKTTTTTALVHRLGLQGIRASILSTDDLYLPHADLQALAASHPTNPLLSGRGQPGTHDIPLGLDLLSRIRHINSLLPPTDPTPPSPPQDRKPNHHAIPASDPIYLPKFDKSLHSGQGDRVRFPDPASIPPHLRIAAPLDVFILEGWNVGFSSLPTERVEQVYRQAERDSPLRRYRLADLVQINTLASEYEAWYRFIDVFCQIEPQSLTHIYTWRLEQEHQLLRQTNGNGMTDAQVQSFVDRYIPGYILFLQTIPTRPRWKGKGLSCTIDLERRCVSQKEW